MDAAVWALLGTIVGAAISAATNYVLAARREQADRARESRHHAIEVKRAARLLDMELMYVEGEAHICVEKRYWSNTDAPRLSAEALERHLDTVAPELSDDAWLTLEIALAAVSNFRTSRDRAVDSILGDKPISDGNAEQLAPMLRDIKRGRGPLASLRLDSQHDG